MLIRLQQGHTNITHQHLLSRYPLPLCNVCSTTSDCTKFTIARTIFFGESPFPYEFLIDCISNINKVFAFTKITNLYNLI